MAFNEVYTDILLDKKASHSLAKTILCPLPSIAELALAKVSHSSKTNEKISHLMIFNISSRFIDGLGFA